MKKIVIIYTENDWVEKEVLKNSPRTRQTLEDWQKKGRGQGVEIYRASIDWYDAERGFFKKAWAFKENKWQKTKQAVAPDFIVDKLAGRQDYAMFARKMQLAQKAPMINSPLFRTMLGNKVAQYLCLGEFMPKSFLVTRKKELLSGLKKIKTKKAVVKPIHGSGGFGIIIDEKKNIQHQRITFPVMLQEFVAGGNIPGVSGKNKLADLRLVFIDHKLIYALSRVAKAGSLFTNFHQGAEVIAIAQTAIPQAVTELVVKIINRLSIYSRANYSLDFMFDRKGKPYLIEINTSPGLDLLQLVGTEEIKAAYFAAILKSLAA